MAQLTTPNTAAFRLTDSVLSKNLHILLSGTSKSREDAGLQQFGGGDGSFGARGGSRSLFGDSVSPARKIERRSKGHHYNYIAENMAGYAEEVRFCRSKKVSQVDIAFIF